LGKIKFYLSEISDWQVSDDQKSISRTYTAKNFITGVQLINAIAQLAEENGHHPDLHLTSYRQLTITLKTHAIDGLSMNDFVMAKSINESILMPAQEQ
jgi:4a-hydroxytetrahydrobiopterin dehydratase